MKFDFDWALANKTGSVMTDESQLISPKKYFASVHH